MGLAKDTNMNLSTRNVLVEQCSPQIVQDRVEVFTTSQPQGTASSEKEGTTVYNCVREYQQQQSSLGNQRFQSRLYYAKHDMGSLLAACCLTLICGHVVAQRVRHRRT